MNQNSEKGLENKLRLVMKYFEFIYLKILLLAKILNAKLVNYFSN